MDEAIKPLETLMTKTDKVHIKGPGTNLNFSTKGIPAIRCAGERNIPDGECFTAPVKDSVEGYIQFNAETLYHGTVFNNIRLEFKNGNSRPLCSFAEPSSALCKIMWVCTLYVGFRFAQKLPAAAACLPAAAPTVPPARRQPSAAWWCLYVMA